MFWYEKKEMKGFKMRYFLLTFLFMGISGIVFAETDYETCTKLILDYDSGKTDDIHIFDECGFNDEKLTWSRWAPYASQKKSKRALYEICKRYPNHLYHDMYCQKAYATGYGPSLVYKAVQTARKGDINQAFKLVNQAIEAGDLGVEEKGMIAETFAIHYLKNNDEKYKTYLQSASENRSALANHISGILLYMASDGKVENTKEAFNHIWRAILLGCESAQENLGLYHLAKQGKISVQEAKDMMQQKMYSCEKTSLETVKTYTSDELSCQCGTALKEESKFVEKPYLLLEVDGMRAVLQDKAGETYSVTEGDNLPNRGTVTEIHKAGVVLKFPNDRIILNLYKTSPCLTFCKEHNITQNLTFDEMKKRLMPDKPRILPYHLTFNAQECDTINYYAPSLVDVTLPYVGKKECDTSHDDMLDRMNKAQEPVEVQNSDVSDLSDEVDTFDEETRKKLYQMGEEFVESESTDSKKKK